MSDIHATIGQKSGDQDDQDDQDDHELMLNRRKEGSGVTIKLRGGCQKKPSSFNNNNNNNKGTTTSKAKQGLAARTYIHFIVSGAFHDNKFTLYKLAEYHRTIKLLDITHSTLLHSTPQVSGHRVSGHLKAAE